MMEEEIVIEGSDQILASVLRPIYNHHRRVENFFSANIQAANTR